MLILERFIEKVAIVSHNVMKHLTSSRLHARACHEGIQTVSSSRNCFRRGYKNSDRIIVVTRRLSAGKVRVNGVLVMVKTMSSKGKINLTE